MPTLFDPHWGNVHCCHFDRQSVKTFNSICRLCAKTGNILASFFLDKQVLVLLCVTILLNLSFIICLKCFETFLIVWKVHNITLFVCFGV